MAQAILIWMIVFSSATPIPKPGKKLAVFIIVVATIAAIIELAYFNGKLILLTAALAGYAWGSLASEWIDQRNQNREKKILDDK